MLSAFVAYIQSVSTFYSKDKIKQLREFVVLFVEHVYFKIQTQTIATCQLSPKNVIRAHHTII